METLVAAPHAGFLSFHLAIHTKRAREFVDLTDDLRETIQASGISAGIAVIASQHTTASIVVNEHEPELLKDLDRFLDRLAPQHRAYGHNGAPCGPDEQPNGHAHCQALLLSSSALLPIVNGEPGLGRYQRVFLVELDRARPRTVTVVLLGS